MSHYTCSTIGRKRLLAVGIQSLLGLALVAEAGLVHAQSLEELMEGEGVVLEEIVVTGFRNALRNASAAKRDTVYVSDSVFSEDVGKFPDLNIAEAINRVPGIQLNREIDGSGLNIAIRGLNTNFTKVTLNGSQIAVASSGRTDTASVNRELDLDVFPTEFFSRLDVNKSPVASMLEGGLAGTVNMRSTRPFDTTTDHISYQAQLGYGELSEKYSPRGSVIGSWKNEAQTFGVVVGLAGVSNKIVTQGYETIGWTNANLTFDQCGTTPTGQNTYGGSPAGSDCNLTGGNGFIIGNPVNRTRAGAAIGSPGYHVTPNNSLIVGEFGAEYGPGTIIDNDFLLDVNPGLTTDQISDALIPRLGRPHYSEGDRDRVASLVSFEWIPSDFTTFFLDVLYAEADREFNRLDMMMVGRNSQLVPTNLEVDSNNVVTYGEFHNAQFFLEARPYTETLDFYNINPGMTLLFGDDMSVDLEMNTSRSEWFRESPTVGITSRMGGGVVATYHNRGGDAPLVESNLDLNDPDNVVGWNWERAYIQNEARETETLGGRLDFTKGDDLTNIKVGLAYDEVSRIIVAYDASYSWENDEVRPTISNNALPDYMMPGPAGFVTVNYDRLFADTNYYALSANAPIIGTSSTSAPTGEVIEETVGAYLEGNMVLDLFSRPLRLNGGVRYVMTDQEIHGLQVLGEGYSVESAMSDYSEALPSFNAAWDWNDNLVIRSSVSRTLTRANPVEMMPNLTFSDQSAQSASQGNPALTPFLANNFDIGLEWYTEDEGYAAINYFRKDIEGFTYTASESVPFSSLGIPFNQLSGAQQTAITQRGGPDAATVFLNQPQNAEGKLNLSGVELLWVQPLSNLMQGLGYTVNYTTVDQKTSGSNTPTFATGVSENIFNLTGYFENEHLTMRLSYSWYDDQIGSGLNADNVTGAQRFIESRGQWDFSGSYQFTDLPTAPKITLNLINFASDPQREIFSHGNAPYTYYDPGYTAIIGISGTFY